MNLERNIDIRLLDTKELELSIDTEQFLEILLRN